jgi:hypothetical protein
VNEGKNEYKIYLTEEQKNELESIQIYLVDEFREKYKKIKCKIERAATIARQFVIE